MKLRDYMKLVRDDAEITIWDKEIDIEVYGYRSMIEENSFFNFLADKVKITGITENGIEVDFYKYFDNRTEKSLKIYNEMFTNESENDEVAGDWVEMLHPIFSGNISEKAELKIIEMFKEIE